MPKGVMWRQEDLFFAGLFGGEPAGEPVKRPEELAERVAAGAPGLTFFPAPPLMHGTSTLTSFIAFNYGQRVALHRKYVPEEVLRTIEREKVSSVSLVGDAMLRPLIDALRGPLRGTDLSSLFSVSSSGAIMSETVRAQFQELVPNVLLLNNFGSSESGSNGRATDDSGPEKGFRLEVNARTRVVDPATHEPVPVGEPGRLAQRGHVPLGYYNDPAKTAETFFQKGGERWVLLGDMATVDEDGVVTVLGRGSQCINTGGEKVYPEEVEQALKSHPDVYDALVAGVPDDRWGSRVTAIVQLRADAPALDLESVQSHSCAARRLQDPARGGLHRPHPALAERQGGLPVGEGGSGRRVAAGGAGGQARPSGRRGVQATQCGRRAAGTVGSPAASAAASRLTASRRVSPGRVYGMRSRCSKRPGSVAKWPPPSIRTPWSSARSRSAAATGSPRSTQNDSPPGGSCQLQRGSFAARAAASTSR